MSTPKTPSRAEKAPAKSERKVMGEEEEGDERAREPSVWAVKPAEYMDIELISRVPIRAISR
jgi:hypothetical protein